MYKVNGVILVPLGMVYLGETSKSSSTTWENMPVHACKYFLMSSNVMLTPPTIFWYTADKSSASTSLDLMVAGTQVFHNQGARSADLNRP